MIIAFKDKYRPFSNFWILRNGVTIPPIANKEWHPDLTIYNSVENAFQAAKTLDYDQRDLIARMPPNEAKTYAYQLMLRNDWEQIKVGIMINLVKQKFDNSTVLRMLLVNSGDEEIIEGNNWHDNEWGVCYCGVCQNDRKYVLLESHNKLGKILMNLRGLYKTQLGIL